MEENKDKLLQYVLAGNLNRDTILPLSGAPMIDKLGGGLTYAAVGMQLWNEQAGLMAKISPDFPRSWLDPFSSYGFDLKGIKTAHDKIDMRRFLAYEDLQTPTYNAPIEQFAKRGLKFPLALLNYENNMIQGAGRGQFNPKSIGISDIPDNYREARAAHICPIDMISHQVVPSILHNGNVQTITMRACKEYMISTAWDDIPGLLSGLTAFMASENEIRNLFQGRSTDIWEMADALSRFGPEYILVRMENGGQYLYDGVSKKRWMLPMYPINIVDPTGGADAFAGG
ncbi:MAG: hypothetical protein MUO40_07175, partial [Anaerolineaceae bacterium]|nr:hypothetical protein [Anaerolineaceae bacterium]